MNDSSFTDVSAHAETALDAARSVADREEVRASQIARDLSDLRDLIETGVIVSIASGVTLVSTSGGVDSRRFRAARADRMFNCLRAANGLERVSGLQGRDVQMAAVGTALQAVCLAAASGDVEALDKLVRPRPAHLRLLHAVTMDPDPDADAKLQEELHALRGERAS